MFLVAPNVSQVFLTILWSSSDMESSLSLPGVALAQALLLLPHTPALLCRSASKGRVRNCRYDPLVLP